MIFPAAIRYQSELAVTCANLKAVGYAFDTNTLDKVTALVKQLQDSTSALAFASLRRARAASSVLLAGAGRQGGRGDAGH